jgi:hypothetical protein
MARFRPRRTFRLVSHLREGHREPLPGWKREEQGLAHDLEERWNTLHRHCADQSGHLRLARLVRRITNGDYGVRESALAELELATQLIRIGAKVTFLPESQARTADLECRFGRERLFVEVTAMVGSSGRQRIPRRLLPNDEWSEGTDPGAMLIHRVLARIQQKTKQLTDYADAVVLSISIPRADLRGERTVRSKVLWLDLKALAGSVTLLLTKLRMLSAVMTHSGMSSRCLPRLVRDWPRGTGRTVETTTRLSTCADPHPESGCHCAPDRTPAGRFLSAALKRVPQLLQILSHHGIAVLRRHFDSCAADRSAFVNEVQLVQRLGKRIVGRRVGRLHDDALSKCLGGFFEISIVHIGFPQSEPRHFIIRIHPQDFFERFNSRIRHVSLSG